MQSAAKPTQAESLDLADEEAMTGAQATFLEALCAEAAVPFEANLTKAAASRRIDELQAIMSRSKDPIGWQK